MSTLKSVLFVVIVAVLSFVLVGCGSVSDVAKSAISSGEQQNIDAKAEREGWPEWMLQSAVNKLCPTGYAAGKSGNTVMCHNPAGQGIKPTPTPAKNDSAALAISALALSLMGFIKRGGRTTISMRQYEQK